MMVSLSPIVSQKLLLTNTVTCSKGLALLRPERDTDSLVGLNVDHVATWLSETHMPLSLLSHTDPIIMRFARLATGGSSLALSTTESWQLFRPPGKRVKAGHQM